MYVFCSQLCSSGDAKNKMCDLFSTKNTKNTSSFQQAFREGAVQLPVAGLLSALWRLQSHLRGDNSQARRVAAAD